MFVFWYSDIEFSAITQTFSTLTFFRGYLVLNQYQSMSLDDDTKTAFIQFTNKFFGLYAKSLNINSADVNSVQSLDSTDMIVLSKFDHLYIYFSKLITESQEINLNRLSIHFIQDKRMSELFQIIGIMNWLQNDLANSETRLTFQQFYICLHVVIKSMARYLSFRLNLIPDEIIQTWISNIIFSIISRIEVFEENDKSKLLVSLI
jgi:hypothetical protein